MRRRRRRGRRRGRRSRRRRRRRRRRGRRRGRRTGRRRRRSTGSGTTTINVFYQRVAAFLGVGVFVFRRLQLIVGSCFLVTRGTLIKVEGTGFQIADGG